MIIEEIRTILSKAVPPIIINRNDMPSVNNLLGRINSREAQLTIHEGRPTCFIRSVILEVTHRVNRNVVQHLIEKERIYPDGKIDTCKRQDGIGMKIRLGETAEQAARRCITEKPCFKVMPTIRRLDRSPSHELRDGAFPCQLTIITLVRFTCEVSESDYDPNGYTLDRIEKGKISKLVWRPRMEPRF